MIFKNRLGRFAKGFILSGYFAWQYLGGVGIFQLFYIVRYVEVRHVLNALISHFGKDMVRGQSCENVICTPAGELRHYANMRIQVTGTQLLFLVGLT